MTLQAQVALERARGSSEPPGDQTFLRFPPAKARVRWLRTSRDAAVRAQSLEQGIGVVR